jgi:hypothetical protein
MLTRYLDLIAITALFISCSHQPSPGATIQKPSAGTRNAAASLCHSTEGNLEAVRLDVDAKFIATHDPFDVLDPVWWSGNMSGSVEDYERCLGPFSREQRLMSAVLSYQSEVENGGHDQFFFNSTGIVYPDAVAGLRELNLTEGAEILTEVGRRMGGAPARDWNERQRQLDKVHPKFDDLDTRFYDLEKQVDLDSIVSDYMRSHANAFTFHGTVQIPRSSLKARKPLSAPK